MSNQLDSITQPKLTQLELEVDKKAKNFAASWYIAMQSGTKESWYYLIAHYQPQTSLI